MTDTEQRLAELERRVAILEAMNQPAGGKAIAPKAPTTGLITVDVRNKQYAPENTALGKYEEHIWFDCYYTLSLDSKPTRAVKGRLEFCDLFGEVKFALNTTLNAPLYPGKVTSHEGIGFTYNQFMNEHQWMLVTELKDMTINFKVLNVIFSDGSSEAFA